MNYECTLSLSHNWTVRTHVVELMRGSGAWTVAEIADMTGKSRSAIRRVLRKMVEEGDARRAFVRRTTGRQGVENGWELVP